MKIVLKVSILLNVVLFFWVIFLLANSPKKKVALPYVASSKVESASVNAAGATPQKSKPVSFHWSDLASAGDYQTYVANLRSIGCPEPTIRAIIEADMREVLAASRPKSQEANQAEVSSPPAGARLADKFLGQKATGTDSARASQNPQRQQQWSAAVDNRSAGTRGDVATRSQQNTVAQYPLIFKDVVVNDPKLNQDQQAYIDHAQQKFVDTVGDPAAPDYRQKWLDAQTSPDDDLRGQLGNQAYMGYLQQNYYANYVKLVLSAGDGPLIINPTELMR